MNAWPSSLLCVLATLAVIAAPLAAGPDRIGQKSGQVTELGQRLVPLNGHVSARGGAYWKALKALVDKSDARADARADAASGHAGFMAHADDAVAGRPVASGVRCFDRSEAGRRAVFLFGYNAQTSPALGPALLAFDAYAARYNREALRGKSLGETSCRATEQ